MRSSLLFLFALLFPLLAQAAVVGSGQASIFNDDEGSARKQALQNALRNAVEKGVGQLLDAKTEVKNWQVIKDEVYSSSQGYVTTYKTLRDERVGNIWFTEVEAEVATSKLQDKLGELRILHKKMGNKRFMLQYRPESAQAKPEDHPATQAALRGLQTALTDKGFRLFDAAATPKTAAAAAGRDDALKAAKDAQVDILVEVEVATGSGGGEQLIQAAKVNVSSRIFDVSTGRQISNQAAMEKQLTNANPGSFDWNNALNKAGEKAALLVAEEATKDVVAFYEATGDTGNAFLIRITGFEEDDEDKLLAILENLEGYQSLSELKNSKGLLEVEYFSSLDKSRLRRLVKLEAKEKKGIRVKSDEASGNYLEFSPQE